LRCLFSLVLHILFLMSLIVLISTFFPYTTLFRSIEHWINDLNESLVIASMERALKNNKKFNYAEGILKDWYRNNIRTLEDVEAKENQFTNKRKTKNKDKEWADF